MQSATKFRKPVAEKSEAQAEADTVFYKKVDATQGLSRMLKDVLF